MDTAVDFDLMQAGAAPSGWVCGVTGKGAPRWTIEADPTAPSKPNVLAKVIEAHGAFDGWES